MVHLGVALVTAWSGDDLSLAHSPAPIFVDVISYTLRRTNKPGSWEACRKRLVVQRQKRGTVVMRRTKALAVICCGLVLGVANIAVAAGGDLYSSAANFTSDKKTKAKKTPILWSVLSIPSDIVEGVEFRVDCVVDARKNKNDAPQSGVKGSAATFAILLDVGSGTWDFDGLVGSGLKFKTKKNGTDLITTGSVTAGPWATDPSDNDPLTVADPFTPNKKVLKTGLYCEIIVGDS